MPPSMLSSSLISCLSASLADKGLFSSVNIADVVRRVVFLLFLANSSPISSSRNEWNVMPFSTHIICQTEKYLKLLSVLSHFKAIYGGNKWKKKPSLPACFPSYSRWGQTHPYLNHSTQKTNYQVFLPQKIPESEISNPPKYPSINSVTWRLCEWLAWLLALSNNQQLPL